MELKTCKMLVLVLLGVIKLVSGLAPMLITKILRKKSRRCLNSLIGIVLCLGGGVLLSTVFLHILPEVRETLERSSAGGLLQLGEEYPLAELVLCLGFLAIFLIETVVCKLFGLGHSHGHGIGGDSEMSVSVNNSKNNTQGAGRPDDPMVPMVHSHNETTHPSRSMPFIGATQFESDKNVYNVSSATLVFSTSFSDLTLDTISDPPTSPSKYLKRNKFISSIRSFLVVLALSIHSVFEGMAIGLQENERGVWKLFIAVSVHATAILFCIGMEMISSGMRKLQIAFYVAVLAAVTPIGVAIGIMVSLDVDQSGEGDVLVIGILQGVAGGTLLYITFFEVLDREKLAKYKMSGMVGILAILVGFGAMASLEGFGGHSHLERGHGHFHIDEAHGYDHLNGGHVHIDEAHGYDHVNGGHGHVHTDEGHAYDHLNGGHGHVHIDEGRGYDHLNRGHGHDHLNGGHGYDHLNGGHGHAHTDKGHGYDQMNAGRGHGHIHEDHGHIHIVGEQGHDNVVGGYGNAPNVGDHRFDPVREDQGHAHTKDIHGDAHAKDKHGNAHAKDIHGNEPASTEARGDNIGQVVEHEHGGLSFDKASEHEHNVSLEQQDLLRDSNTLGHVHSDNEDFHLEHDDSRVAVHGHNDNIKDGEALNHTHHVDQDVELEQNDHLETAGQVHNHGDSLGLDQVHIQESNNEVEHKLDHLVLMKNPVGKNNRKIEKNNVEQKGEQDIILSHEILDNDSSHSDRQASLNLVLNEENNGRNKSEFAEFDGKLSDESIEKSDSNPSNTKQVDDKETMLNDKTKNDKVISSEDDKETMLNDKTKNHNKVISSEDDKETMLNDKTKNHNKVISSEDHVIVRDKEGGHGNDSSHTEDNSVLSSLVGQLDNSNQTENETHTKGHNVDSDNNEFISDKSQTVVLIDENDRSGAKSAAVLIDENDRSGAKSDDVTALNTIKLDTITDVHREDTLIIEGENENGTSSNNSSKNNVSNDSDINPMVHQEVFSNQSKASMNDNTLEEGNVKLNNSEIVDDLNDSFEEVPILNNTSEVFFDFNDFVYNGQEVKGQGDSPPLEIIKDLENDKNETTLVNSDIVFFEESTDDKTSKNVIKENVKPDDIDSNQHDVGIDEQDNNIDSVKNHVKSDKPQPWWTAFF